MLLLEAHSSRRLKENKTGEDGAAGSLWDPLRDFPDREAMGRHPDIGEDGGRDYYTLWYTTAVHLPELGGDVGTSANSANDARKRRGHLTLHGVNYRPIVYFDGKLLRPYSAAGADGDGPTAQEDAGGMFLRRRYDLGVREASAGDRGPSRVPLEVLVMPPPYVGRPVPLNGTDTNYTRSLESGQGGDHNLARSGAVMQFAAGWDWIRSTPDRNAGIWDRVEVDWVPGDVRLHDVRVDVSSIAVEGAGPAGRDGGESRLPLGDNVAVSARIDLSVTVTYHDKHDGATPVTGQIEYWIASTSTPATILSSGMMKNITIHDSAADHHLGSVALSNARLWWPHTHSTRPRQALYSVRVEFRGGRDGDPTLHTSRATASFGLRTVAAFTHPRTKSFALAVNGHPVFLAGGNWITTDQFLRHATSQRRYLQELSILKQAGFNAIRVWGGGVAETEAFYEAADVLGLLVYQVSMPL